MKKISRKLEIGKRLKETKESWEEMTREEVSIISERLKDFPILKRKIINLKYIYPRYKDLERLRNEERFKTIAEKLRELAKNVEDIEFNN